MPYLRWAMTAAAIMSPYENLGAQPGAAVATCRPQPRFAQRDHDATSGV